MPRCELLVVEEAGELESVGVLLQEGKQDIETDAEVAVDGDNVEEEGRDGMEAEDGFHKATTNDGEENDLYLQEVAAVHEDDTQTNGFFGRG
ncbi:MAG: hypothetical protein SGARI_000496 [Bacillariaceae sp.]